MRTLKEKDAIFNERVEQGLSRIDKMEEVIHKVGSAFTPSKANEVTSRSKSPKFIYIPKSVSTYPTKRNKHIKMISVHLDFPNLIKEPIFKSPIVTITLGGTVEDVDVKDENT